MDESTDESPPGGFDAEIKELLGLFDIPAFARRGQDVEYGLIRVRALCRRRRSEMLDMVRLRLRQWATAAPSPEAASRFFDGPIAGLWPEAGVEPPDRWGARAASARGLRAIARDLVASVERFNRRWSKYLDEVDLTTLRRQVDLYNKYYLLEKECVLGSSRLAARHFEPQAHPTVDALRAELPTLPVPQPIR